MILTSKAFTKILLFSIATILLNSCGMYRQNIMFQTKKGDYQELVKVAEKNYLIKSGDILQLDVYSNNGEIIIDPNFALRKEIGINNGAGVIKQPQFLVKEDGYVKLPMVNNVKVGGLTVVQTDSLLSALYSQHYVDAFVSTSLSNRRVVVLGGTGGLVIPLLNENMSLMEVIALAGGIANTAKAHNIRLIRGDYQNPQVEVIDLTTIEGMQKANLNVQPNDVIYIEPIRKVITETIRDISPILTLITSLLTLSIILSRNN